MSPAAFGVLGFPVPDKLQRQLKFWPFLGSSLRGFFGSSFSFYQARVLAFLGLEFWPFLGSSFRGFLAQVLVFIGLEF